MINTTLCYIEKDNRSLMLHRTKIENDLGEVTECSEGVLEWVNKEEVMKLNLWQGDRIFLKKIMKEDNFFTLKVVYEGEQLVESVVEDY